ncbi:MAG: ribonuclease D, partial [Gammaproteobacteria bacterium]|nr:ribonuclease D [Gammaproteobacteria bacterium]
MIQTNEALAGACRAWLEQDCVGVDTEFERTRTYFARPGLVQVSVGDRVYLLDPLELSDWTPFAALLGSPRVQIVMHAGSEDIGLLWRLTGVQPVNLFDTQIAAGLSSLEANPSYQKLVKQTIGEDIDKGESRSDWLKRPLSPAQLEYAALD